jgi:hypothetical protein
VRAARRPVRSRLAAVLSVVLLAGSACTTRHLEGDGGNRTPTAPASSGGSGERFPPGQPLCNQPASPISPPVSASPLPRPIAKVAEQVQLVRGLTFRRPVTPEPLTREEIDKLLADSLKESFPPDVEADRGKALITMGALPPGTDLYQAIVDFGTSQIIGFYDTTSHKLVFIGSQAPTPLERLTLAHELTHAVDDQAFDLSRVDQLARTCQDERVDAFLSLAEGDAQETSFAWARQYLTGDEITELQQEAADAGASTVDVPPFVENLMTFPYPNGQAFVEALLVRGGRDAVDDAFRNPPISTEQILHPDKYPGDLPQTVQVPDLASKLGTGWKAIDVGDVGEGWLDILMGLQLPQPEADQAGGGWDGGRYRAWSDGAHTAVLLDTVWDTSEDADEFASAMERFVGTRPADVQRPAATSVRVSFASDAGTLEELEAAAAAAAAA